MDKGIISEEPAMAGIGHLSATGLAGRDKPNQDSFRLPAHVSAQLGSKGWLFCVADGSGSNEGEQRGSQIAVSLVEQICHRDRGTDMGQRLKHAVETANREIFERSGGVLFNDLSASLVCAVVTRTGITVTHAGDCRAYLVTPQHIRRLTQDHVIEQPDSASAVDPDQSHASPVRLVTLSVGGMPTIDLDCKTFAFQPDARIVLCTQGLTNVVSDNEISEIARSGEPESAARRLVALAKERGSAHDITVVVVDPSVLLGKQTSKLPFLDAIGIPKLIGTGFGLILLVTAAVAVVGSWAFDRTESIAGTPGASSPTSPVRASSALAAVPIAPFPSATTTATATPTATDTPTHTSTFTPTATPTPPSTSTMEPTASPTSSPLPTYTAMPPTPAPAATAILALAAINLAGTWVHNFGTMNLSQSGTTITGNYLNAFANANGSIAGTRTGSVINGTWTIGGDSGVFQWTVSPGKQTFMGTWGGSVLWCGARSGQALPANCGYSGRWNIRLKGDTHTMDLTQTGASVTGQYFNGGANGTIDGTIGYSGNAVVLTGTWHVGSTSGPLHFKYYDFPSDRFQGNYNTTSEWCGWRDTATQPSPCLK